MSRLSREQQQQRNRARLLAAAERTFATMGVAGASLDDVAVEAGLTKGAVYSNFRGKGELILAVIRERLISSGEAHRFHEILESAANDSQRLEAWCDIWVMTANSGERSSYARLLLEFIPYALRDEELTAGLLEFITPGDIPPESSPIPADSLFARIPVGDQFRILTALDIGLAALGLLDTVNVKPELYKTAVLSLAYTTYDGATKKESQETDKT